MPGGAGADRSDAQELVLAIEV
ncbi:Protein of unknown function [Propionibacterium freudenreichii]|nr:Protein of unknown function [Propionibacterium freudenreichii]